MFCLVLLVPDIGMAVWLLYIISQVYDAVYIVTIIAVVITTIFVGSVHMYVVECPLGLGFK